MLFQLFKNNNLYKINFPRNLYSVTLYNLKGDECMNQDFNQTKVISQVMELFWNKGYEATTIEDILKVTELNMNKFSEVFGSKEQLYLMTFNYYSF